MRPIQKLAHIQDLDYQIAHEEREDQLIRLRSQRSVYIHSLREYYLQEFKLVTSFYVKDTIRVRTFLSHNENGIPYNLGFVYQIEFSLNGYSVHLEQRWNKETCKHEWTISIDGTIQEITINKLEAFKDVILKVTELVQNLDRIYMERLEEV